MGKGCCLELYQTCIFCYPRHWILFLLGDIVEPDCDGAYFAVRSARLYDRMFVASLTQLALASVHSGNADSESSRNGSRLRCVVVASCLVHRRCGLYHRIDRTRRKPCAPASHCGSACFVWMDCLDIVGSVSGWQGLALRMASSDLFSKTLLAAIDMARC